MRKKTKNKKTSVHYVEKNTKHGISVNSKRAQKDYETRYGCLGKVVSSTLSKR